MHIFITGASGQTGPAVITELIAAGHKVTGLVRSAEAADRLGQLGANVLHGSLDDLAVLRQGAEAADGVIHMAYGGDFSDPEAGTRRDCAAIRALGESLVNTGKPLVSTSGTLVFAAGRVTTEKESPDPQSLGRHRIAGEEACLALADKGVRAIVVRLAPTVHGPKDHGFIPLLVSTARRKGASVFIGDGANRWPAVHRRDAATLFRLAVEKAPAGIALHGVGESAVTFATIARSIGQQLQVPTTTLAAERAAAHFGNPFLATAFATDAPASSAYTRALLGWEPSHPTLLEDLELGDYFSPEARSAFDNSTH